LLFHDPPSAAPQYGTIKAAVERLIVGIAFGAVRLWAGGAFDVWIEIRIG
jgi:hypothetical protein